MGWGFSHPISQSNAVFMFLNSKTQKIILKIFCITAFLIVSLPLHTFADTAPTNTPTNTPASNAPVTGNYGLTEATEGTGLVNTSLSERVGTFISAVVGFVGVIFLLLMVYGGLTWMTAGGNEEKIGKAKKIIVNSVIGIILVMLSYAIVQFIMSRVA